MLQRVLGLGGDGEYKTVSIHLTGSRASGLAYPESDIDFAFVADDSKILESVHQRLLRLHADGVVYKEFKLLSRTTTTGLPWCPIDGFVDAKHKIGPTKLDITFRTRAVHDAIQTHVANQIKLRFPSDEHRADYIRAMQHAHASNDNKTYNNLKEWLRLLPPTTGTETAAKTATTTTDTPLHSTPLAQDAKALSVHMSRNRLVITSNQTPMVVAAQDKSKGFFLGEARIERNGLVHVHFEHFDSQFDEWMPNDGSRLRALEQHTITVRGDPAVDIQIKTLRVRNDIITWMETVHVGDLVDVFLRGQCTHDGRGRWCQGKILAIGKTHDIIQILGAHFTIVSMQRDSSSRLYVLPYGSITNWLSIWV